MTSLLLCLTMLGQPTQIDLLIDGLANPSYEIRKSAFADLRDIGHATLPVLRRHLKDDDYNVKTCCRILIAHYFSEAENDIPSIWLLPRATRMVGKTDIAAEYYEKARLHINHYWEDIDEIEKDDYTSEVCCELALKMLFRDMLEKEDARNEVKLIKRQCRILECMLTDCRDYGYDYRWNFGYAKVPPPIEEVIEEYKKYMKIYGGK